MYALIDPNWGKPRVVTETLRDTEEAVWRVAVREPSVSLYSGAYGIHGAPENITPGKRSTLEHYGFRVARVRVEIENP